MSTSPATFSRPPSSPPPSSYTLLSSFSALISGSTKDSSFRQLPRYNMEDCIAMESYASESSAKQRMRWTPEMRNRFEDAVNNLGGPDRATPKGILRAMSVPGLTIAHVKSYLQKYRMSKFVPESSDGGRLESRKFSEILPNFSTTSRVQINEALQLHMEGQQRLDNGFEVQKHLKVKIELQGRYLEEITKDDDFSNNFRPDSPFSPGNFPSVCEVFDPSRNEPRIRVINEVDFSGIQQEWDVANSCYSGVPSFTGMYITSNDVQFPKRLRVANDTC